MKIGIFGGTFDPPHNGHLTIAKRIIEKKIVDKLIFIPSFSPPHKPNIPISSFEDRYNMIKIAVQELKDSYYISDIERRLKKTPSYTLDVIKHIKKLYPNDKLLMIIGEDSLYNLHSWHKAEDLVKEVDLITYPRKGYKVSFDYLKRYWDNDLASKLLKSILTIEEIDISSTDIRKAIEQKDIDFIKKNIPQAVFKYILDNAIYGKL